MLNNLIIWLIFFLFGLNCGGNNNKKQDFSQISSFSDHVAHVYPNNDPQNTLTVVCKDGRQLCYSEAEFYSKVKLLCEEGLSGNKWYVEFFNNTNLSGCPAWRGEFDSFPTWHTSGRPLNIAQVNEDNFSARLKYKQLYVTPDILRFEFAYDDGINVGISGCPSFTDWQQGGMRKKNIDCRIDSPRTLDIQIEYFELGGMADLEFSYNRLVVVEPLATPSNFRVSQFDAAGNFLLDWDRISGAHYYEVEVHLGNNANGILYHNGLLRADNDDIWIVKNDLQGYSSVTYRVRARNNQGQESAWSGFTTYALPTSPPVIIIPPTVTPVPPTYSGRCDAHPQWGDDCGRHYRTKCIMSCYNDNGTYMQYGTPICRVQGSLTRC